jgi:hypothetical protein
MRLQYQRRAAPDCPEQHGGAAALGHRERHWSAKAGAASEYGEQHWSANGVAAPDLRERHCSGKGPRHLSAESGSGAPRAVAQQHCDWLEYYR